MLDDGKNNGKKRRERPEPGPHDAMTIGQASRRAGVSKVTFLRLRAAGKGPREMRMLGGVVRISAEAFRDWIAERERDPAAEQRAKLKQRSDAANAGGR